MITSLFYHTSGISPQLLESRVLANQQHVFKRFLVYLPNSLIHLNNTERIRPIAQWVSSCLTAHCISLLVEPPVHRLPKHFQCQHNSLNLRCLALTCVFYFSANSKNNELKCKFCIIEHLVLLLCSSKVIDLHRIEKLTDRLTLSSYERN